MEPARVLDCFQAHGVGTRDSNGIETLAKDEKKIFAATLLFRTMLQDKS